MFIARSILRAPTDGAPEGNGAAPAPSQSALPLDGQQPAPPAAPAEPAKPKIDPSDPELRKLVQAAAKKAVEEAAAAERAKIEEEKKLAQLDAESRAKAEKKKAEDEAASAKAEAEKAKAEAAFTRSLLAADLAPQTELAESMALAAAKELVAQGVPWADAVTRVGKEHAYLFKSRAAAPAAAAPSGDSQPASPSAVHAARNLTVGGSAAPSNAGGAQVPTDAFAMNREQWEKELARIKAGGKVQ